MKYNKFIIKNYRAIEGPIEINIQKNKLVPLIGTNESGKLQYYKQFLHLIMQTIRNMREGI